MKIRPVVCSLAACVLISAATADDSPRQVPEPSSLITKRVPHELRLHLPRLAADRGLWVESVPPGSAAAKVGVLPGDILLKAAGVTVPSDGEPANIDPAQETLVIRRGRMKVLRGESQWGVWPAAGAVPQARAIPRTLSPGAGAPRLGMPSGLPGWIGRRPGTPGVSASAFSSGGGSAAVSVSQVGNQITAEVSLPTLDQPLRLRGTASEIEQQISRSRLTEAAKREVRAALRSAF